MHGPLYSNYYPRLKTPSNSEYEAADVLARAARGDLKALAKIFREIARSRYCPERDRKRAIRKVHAISGALAVLRSGGRS
jgi:hypothetical protein